MKKYQYLYKQSFDLMGRASDWYQDRISPTAFGNAMGEKVINKLEPYTVQDYQGDDYYSAMMGKGNETRQMLNKRISNNFLGAFDEEYGDEALNVAMRKSTPTIQNVINNKFHSYVTNELKDTEGQNNYWQHVPESWRDNIMKMTVNTQDDNIRQDILNNMKKGMREQVGDVLDEEMVNKFMSNYLQTDQGKKVYAQLFNKKMNDITSSISGFLNKYKWPIAGAGGLGLLLLLGKGLLGGKQQPQQRRQARYINPMNRFYS